MSAKKEVTSVSSPKLTSLAILSGNGKLPDYLANYYQNQGTSIFIIDYNCDQNWYEDFDHISLKLGQVGKLLKELNTRKVNDVCLIGGLDRPALKALKPDFEGAKFLTSLATKNLGDDGLLSFVKQYLENKGLNVHGFHELMPHFIAPKGCLTRKKPSKNDHKDIEYGIEICSQIGKADIGQSVIIQDGLILGVEAIEGTDQLIRRCSDYKAQESGGVLVKMIKPDQDPSLDMPTIGINTLKNLHDAGFAGVAYSSDKTILVDQDALIDLADQYDLFLIGA